MTLRMAMAGLIIGASVAAALAERQVQLTPEMRTYASRLERAFLTTGISANVYGESNGPISGYSGDTGQWPRLIVFTYLTKATVFNLINDGKILEGANQAGFRMVQLTDKGREGQWFFDLTQSNVCSRGLCWTNPAPQAAAPARR